MFLSRKVNPWRVPGSRILGWCWRIAFVFTGDDSCKYTGRRRWLRWGMNLANGLLCGEKSTLTILLGSNTLWGERYFAEMLMVTLLGIRGLCWERSFRGFWLRITQLYPGREITLWIKPGDVFVLCEDKLPESTRDKLTVRGDGFQLSWGTRLDSPGEVLNCNFVSRKREPM